MVAQIVVAWRLTLLLRYSFRQRAGFISDTTVHGSVSPIGKSFHIYRGNVRWIGFDAGQRTLMLVCEPHLMGRVETFCDVFALGLSINVIALWVLRELPVRDSLFKVPTGLFLHEHFISRTFITWVFRESSIRWLRLKGRRTYGNIKHRLVGLVPTVFYCWNRTSIVVTGFGSQLLFVSSGWS
jgi:hypothetical protein